MVFKLLANEDITSEERKNFILSEINDHQQKLMVFNKYFGGMLYREDLLLFIVLKYYKIFLENTFSLKGEKNND